MIYLHIHVNSFNIFNIRKKTGEHCTKRTVGWGRGLGASGTGEAADQQQPRPAGAGPSAAAQPPAAGWRPAPGNMGQHSSLIRRFCRKKRRSKSTNH